MLYAASMQVERIITLRRVSYTVTNPAKAHHKIGIKVLDGVFTFLGKVLPPEPLTTSQRFCFSLLLDDNSEKRFDYQPHVTEPEALQQAVNFAASLGYSTDLKSISMFGNRKIDHLYLRRSLG